MTIRIFWTIVIKFLGLWLVIDFFAVILQFISSLIFLKEQDGGGMELILSVAGLLITLGLYYLVLRIFVFKTEWIIDKLRLDKGFSEERIGLKISSTTVISIATIMIGGFLIIESLPSFCKQVFIFFQQKSIFRANPSSGFIIFHFVKMIIGFIIMTNSIFIAKTVNREVTKEQTEIETND